MLGCKRQGPRVTTGGLQRLGSAQRLWSSACRGCGASRGESFVGPGFYIGMNRLDLLRTHDALERGHPTVGPAFAYDLSELLRAIHWSTRGQGNQEVGCYRIGKHVLPMATRAIHAVLPPSLVLSPAYLPRPTPRWLSAWLLAACRGRVSRSRRLRRCDRRCCCRRIGSGHRVDGCGRIDPRRAGVV